MARTFTVGGMIRRRVREERRGEREKERERKQV